jgi:hypothetical protein
MTTSLLRLSEMGSDFREKKRIGEDSTYDSCKERYCLINGK